MRLAVSLNFLLLDIVLLPLSGADLTDLGLDEYAQDQCYLLKDEKYGKLKLGEGVLFTTYNTLIAKGKGTGKFQSRLEQIIDWCGGDSFDGLIMLDECHKVRGR